MKATQITHCSSCNPAWSAKQHCTREHAKISFLQPPIENKIRLKKRRAPGDAEPSRGRQHGTHLTSASAWWIRLELTSSSQLTVAAEDPCHRKVCLNEVSIFAKRLGRLLQRVQRLCNLQHALFSIIVGSDVSYGKSDVHSIGQPIAPATSIGDLAEAGVGLKEGRGTSTPQAIREKQTQ